MSLRGAITVVAASRLAVWLAALLALGLAVPRRNPLLADHDWHPQPFPGQTVLEHLLHLGDRWDATWYLGIARDGYGGAARETAFFPLYPLLVRGVSELGLGLVAAGTACALAATVAAAWLLGRLALELPGGSPAAARTAVLLWCLFPAAVVLGSIYPESLLAAAVAGTWLLALRGRRLLAGALCGVALLTKPLGVVALPLLLLQAGRDSARPWTTLRTWAAVLVAGVLFAIWPLWLWLQFGSGWLFLQGQASWGRASSAEGVLTGAWRSGAAAGEAVWSFAREPLDVTSAGMPTFGDPIGLGMQDAMGAGAILVLLVTAVAAWRLLGPAAGSSCGLLVVVALATAAQDVPLMSAPRFALVALPAFVVGAQLVERAGVTAAAVFGSAVLLGASSAAWATWQWLY